MNIFSVSDCKLIVAVENNQKKTGRVNNLQLSFNISSTKDRKNLSAGFHGIEERRKHH